MGSLGNGFLLRVSGLFFLLKTHPLKRDSEDTILVPITWKGQRMQCVIDAGCPSS